MRQKLGELLIQAGAATAADVEAVLAEQSAGEPSRIGDLLLAMGRCTHAQIAQALATQHDLPFADLSYVAPEASALIPLEFQRAHKLVPFRVDKEKAQTRVHVALADPTVLDVIAELRAQLKREVVVHVAPINDIENVHQALAGESSGDAVLEGTVVEEEPGPEVTAAFRFTPPADSPTAVSADDLFGSLDLGANAEEVPLSGDLADQIGRPDPKPSNPEARGFRALAEPLEPMVDRFGASPPEPLSVEPEPLLSVPAVEVPSEWSEVEEEPVLEMLEPLIEDAFTAEPLPAEAAPSVDAPSVDAPSVDAPFAPTVETPVVVVAAAMLSPVPDVDVDPISEEHTQKFGGSFASLSVGPAPEPPPAEVKKPPAPRTPGTLGRLALKRVAVNRDGTPAAIPVAGVAAATPAPADDVPWAATTPSTEPEITVESVAKSRRASSLAATPARGSLAAAKVEAATADFAAFAFSPDADLNLDSGPLDTSPFPLGPADAPIARSLAPSVEEPPGAPLPPTGVPRAASIPRAAAMPPPTAESPGSLEALESPEKPRSPESAEKPKSDDGLPEWMRGGPADPAALDPIPAATLARFEVSEKLEALLARVETCELPSGPVLASVLRLLVERAVLDDEAVSAALEKL